MLGTLRFAQPTQLFYSMHYINALPQPDVSQGSPALRQ